MLDHKQISEMTTVIVRSVGERTTAACIYLLQQALPDSEITCINEIPFSKAVKRTFEIGIEKNRKWTLVIDADVLIRAGFISEIVSFAETQPDNTFVIQGLILDKFMNAFRPAGNHLYRTKHFNMALKFIPPEGSTLRPEFTTTTKMAQNGHLFIQKKFIAGLHDYEQSYSDILKKCFVHACKHKNMINIVLTLWEKKAKVDNDFYFAIHGAKHGLKYKKTLYIDYNFINNLISSIKNIRSVNGQSNLELNTYNQDIINQIISMGISDPDRQRIQEEIYPQKKWDNIRGKQSVTQEDVSISPSSFCKAVFKYESTGIIEHLPHNIRKTMREYREGNLLQDIKFFSHLIDTNPNDPVVLYFFALHAIQLGLMDQGKKILTNLANAHPEFSSAFNALGEMERGAGNLEEATTCFKKAIRALPDNKDARRNLLDAERALTRRQENPGADYRFPDILVCLLNYKRPQNLHKIIAALRRQSIKPRIALWDNSEEQNEKFDVDILIRSSQNSYCLPRWFVAAQHGEDYVCIMDDDLISTDGLLFEKCIESCQKYLDRRIIGFRGSNLNDNDPFYHPTKNTVRASDRNISVDIIKGRFMFLHSKIISDIPMRIIPYKDRGDDICLSHFTSKHKKYHIIPNFIANSISEIEEGDESLSKDPSHPIKRNKITKDILVLKNNIL